MHSSEQAELHQLDGSSSARRGTEPATSHGNFEGSAGLRTASASAASPQSGNGSSDTDTAATAAEPPRQARAQAHAGGDLPSEDSNTRPTQLPSTGQEQQVHDGSIA